MTALELEIDYARRKERLVARAAAQRTALELELRAFERPIALVDRGIAIARFLKANPGLLVAGGALMAVAGRRNVMRWAVRGLALWRGWRALTAWGRNFGV